MKFEMRVAYSRNYSEIKKNGYKIPSQGNENTKMKQIIFIFFPISKNKTKWNLDYTFIILYTLGQGPQWI